MRQEKRNRFGGAAIVDINMVPMIDVMLVLVVILLVTAPILTRSVPLVLPKTQTQAAPPREAPIRISIDESGHFFWDNNAIERLDIQIKMKETARMAIQNQSELPSVQIHADEGVPYRYVAYLLADAAMAGITKIGFVTQPETQ